MDEDEERWLDPEDCTDDELGLNVMITEARRAQLQRERHLRRQRWQYLPDDPTPEALTVSPATVGAVLRTARGHVRLNQRELAAAAGVPCASLARAEATGVPDDSVGSDDHVDSVGADLRLSTLVRLLDACGLALGVVDADGTRLAAPYGRDQLQDAAGRRLPAHLDTYAPGDTHRSRYGKGAHRHPPHRVTAGRRRTNAARIAGATRAADSCG